MIYQAPGVGIAVNRQRHGCLGRGLGVKEAGRRDSVTLVCRAAGASSSTAIPCL
jgi:hypothetical protein